MSEYRIRYSIIPPGIGPDDYEPADLEQREELFAFPDPEDTHTLATGTTVTVGPSVAAINAAVQERLGPGATAAILSVRAPGEA
ncbi:hypothetical protein [Streptomyces sp. BE230]|uniref:hypothetical protein n=1 Tax=Streptomyces sp. BE230 TaxID=3002526 RepID=UPI002ED5E572|nr:hypothetical protein [Streptomyces sp. BE230]